MENTIYVKKIIILSYNSCIDIGELRVDNQSLPYEFPKLYVNIDVRARSYEPYIELVKKIKIKLYGIHGKTWFYEFEPSFESYCISVKKNYKKENIFWEIKASPKDEDVSLYGVILHAHKLSDLYDNLKDVQKKAEHDFRFKSFENFYLKGTLHSTNLVEKVYLYTIKEENELIEFLSKVIGKKVEILVMNIL